MFECIEMHNPEEYKLEMQILKRILYTCSFYLYYSPVHVKNIYEILRGEKYIKYYIYSLHTSENKL